MKKSLLFVGSALFASAILSGCATQNTSQGAYAPEVKVEKSYEAVIQKQDKAVAGDATVNCLFGIFTWGVSNFADDAFVMQQNSNSFSLTMNPADVAKRGATYNACANAKSDMLLGAKYVVDTKDYFVFKTIKCTATGFPGVLQAVK
ncbi:MAG: hypothetical protein PHI85_07760 [Victivallaceae bacterium]|nr:hypothetical protein [Victivallaceae bacterium]